MVIKLSKSASKTEVEKAREKLRRKKATKGSPGKYFGALKRGLDGLDYQKKARNEWA